jgi:hypothetical protein
MLAGVLLALATIKPQLALPIAAWLTLWALSGWRRRWHFLAGFYLTLATLFAGAEYELPGWITRFRAALAAYHQYAGGRSVLDELLSPSLGKVFSGLVVLAVAAVCWSKRTEPENAPSFAVTMSLVLAATAVVIPMFAPYNQVLLLPAIFLAARSWSALWNRSSAARVIALVAAVLTFWPWFAVICLTVASLFLPAATVQRAWAVPLYTSLGIPLGVLALLAFLVVP